MRGKGMWCKFLRNEGRATRNRAIWLATNQLFDSTAESASIEREKMARAKSTSSRKIKKLGRTGHSLRSDREQFLSSIDRLLTTAADLMRKEPAIDPQAFEYLRQLRVRIRFALRSVKASDDLPAEAPSKWLDRADKAEDAVSFVRRVYAPWLGKGVSRPDIRRLDKSLYHALSNWVTKNGPLPSDVHLPTKKELYDTRLESVATSSAPSRHKRVSELSESEKQMVRLHDVARWRKRHPPK